MLYEKNVSTYKILHSREEELPTSILLGIWVCNAFQGKILFLVILVKCNVHQKSVYMYHYWYIVFCSNKTGDSERHFLSFKKLELMVVNITICSNTHYSEKPLLKI